MRWQSGVETLVIFALLLAYAGEPTPAVNEAHYLAKAKHYWNPTWAAGDMFLESADAHLVFYWTFGWITRFVSLPATAWIGRLVTWGLLAWAWQRLSWAVVPQLGWAPLSAALLLTLSHWCSMAGEWLVGGVEAKGFAYVLLVLALERLVKNHWRPVWPLLGLAASFHVLTGGWGVVAAGVAWVVQKATEPRDAPERVSGDPTDEPATAPSLLRMAPWLAIGLILALPGLIPAVALTRGVPEEIVREANQIYVFQRLSHHLVFSTFAPHLVERFAALTVAWAVLAMALRRQARQRRLAGFVLGSLVIATGGVVLDWALESRPDMAAAVLRFYWFRLSDVAVPMGAALAFTGCAVLAGRRWMVLTGAVVAVAAIWSMATLLSVVAGRAGDPRGGADVQALPANPRRPEWTERVYRDWRETTGWIHENTPPDAIFLAPRSQQTFVWYSGRGQVVNRKDIPQDAAGLVEWSHRMARVYPPVATRGEWAGMTDEQLIELGREYGADFLVLDRTRHVSRKGLTRVYPVQLEAESLYQVYRLPSAEVETPSSGK